MIWAIVLFFVLLYIIWSITDKDNPLDRLPGPPKRPIIGSTLEFLFLTSGELFKKVRSMGREYGDTYVVKVFERRIVHTFKVENVELVLSHSKNISKSRPYSFLQDWLGTGLLTSTGGKWFKRRKILTPAFHFNILKNFSRVMDEKSLGLVDVLTAKQGEEVNVTAAISDFTLFTICETAMGTQLDLDKTTATVEYKTAIKQIGNLLLARLTRFWLHNNFIFRQSLIGKQFQKCLTTVQTFADKVVAERKKQRINLKELNVHNEAETDDTFGSKKRLAMLDLLLEAESKGEIDLEGIREEVNTFMFEGHDTTAVGLMFCLMVLSEHREVQDRIYEECKDILGDSPASITNLAELKYLEAVIKESLRLYPSVPFIARTITEEFVMDGIQVPKGSEVAVHIYDLHRRADIYPEPEQFRPERFLSGETRHPYAYVPFSAGLRNCIGQRFAMTEMKCVLSKICSKFIIKPPENGNHPTLITDLVLRPVEPIFLKFVPR